MNNDQRDDAIQALLDKEAIHDALMRYCRGVDRCDEDLMRSVYHPDAVDHHGTFRGRAWDFVDAFIPQSKQESTFTMHAIANLTIELSGDVADSEAYFVAYVGRMENDAEVIDAFGGRYVDRWQRREGDWKVSRREVVHEWSRADCFGGRPFPLPTEAFAQPVRGRGDLVFRGPKELAG